MHSHAWRRISLEMATQRLERAAELGRLEREREQVQQSILDLSGDLKAAHIERAAGQSSAAELSPKPDDTAARARERWLREREAHANKGQTPEEIQAQARENWKEYRERVARGDVAAQERVLVVMEFQKLAQSRAANRDSVKSWEATPKHLRDAIERYNREPPQVQREILKAIAMQPEAAKAIGEGVQLRRAQILDRGPSLEL